MIPLGPPGEKDWDPTNMFSGSLAGSRLSCRLRIRSLHGLFLIQCSRDGNTMVPKRGSNTSSWLENKSAHSDTGSQGQTYKKKKIFFEPSSSFFLYPRLPLTSFIL